MRHGKNYNRVGWGQRGEPCGRREGRTRPIEWCVPLPQGGPNTPLKIDGLCGPKTTGAIHAFQLRQFGPPRADSRVDPGGPTLTSLNELSATSGGLLGPDVCLLLDPCPIDVKTASLFQIGTGPSFVLASFVPTSAPAGGGDAAIMQAAFKDSRTTRGRVDSLDEVRFRAGEEFV